MAAGASAVDTTWWWPAACLGVLFSRGFFSAATEARVANIFAPHELLRAAPCGVVAKTEVRASVLLIFFLLLFETKRYGGDGYRSRYLMHAKHSLYHVSYTPYFSKLEEVTKFNKTAVITTPGVFGWTFLHYLSNF